MINQLAKTYDIEQISENRYSLALSRFYTLDITTNDQGKVLKIYDESTSVSGCDFEVDRNGQLILGDRISGFEGDFLQIAEEAGVELFANLFFHSGKPKEKFSPEELVECSYIALFFSEPEDSTEPWVRVGANVLNQAFNSVLLKTAERYVG